MPRPSRARRILKWTGVGLTASVIALWVLTARYDVKTLRLGSMYLGFGWDGAWITVFKYPEEWEVISEVSIHDWRDSLTFRLPFFETTSEDLRCFVPFWLLLLLTAIPTAWLWHRDRRRIRPGCCLRCGYDLTGNTSGVCSECGLAKPPPAIV